MKSIWVKVGCLLAALVVILVGLSFLSSNGDEVESGPIVEPKADEESRPKTVAEVFRKDDERLRADPVVEPNDSQEEVQYRELELEEEYHASKLFEQALAERKMGRLPGMSFKLMVDHCREIIEKYPGSIWDAKARRMLGDLPERYRKRYNITAEEIELPK